MRHCPAVTSHKWIAVPQNSLAHLISTSPKLPVICPSMYSSVFASYKNAFPQLNSALIRSSDVRKSARVPQGLTFRKDRSPAGSCMSRQTPGSLQTLQYPVSVPRTRTNITAGGNISPSWVGVGGVGGGQLIRPKPRLAPCGHRTFVLHSPLEFYDDGFAGEIVQERLRVHRHRLRMNTTSAVRFGGRLFGDVCRQAACRVHHAISMQINNTSCSPLPYLRAPPQPERSDQSGTCKKTEGARLMDYDLASV